MAERSVTYLLLTVFFHIIILFIAFIPFIILEVRTQPLIIRGFFCDDETISYPYKPDTVNVPALLQGTLLISTGFIFLTELIRFMYIRCGGRRIAPYPVNSLCNIPDIVVRLYRILGILYLGFAVILSLMDCFKYGVGRLRPNFLAVCGVNLASLNCTNPTTKEYIYVDMYSCSSPYPPATLKDSRLSFPSGHAALSAYFAFFLVFYIQKRWTWHQVLVLKHILQALAIGVGGWITLTRINDNKHHWSDVLAGGILGTAIAVVACFYSIRFFDDFGPVEHVNVVEKMETVKPTAVAIEAPANDVLHMPVKSVDVTPHFPSLATFSTTSCGGHCTPIYNPTTTQPYGVLSRVIHYQ